MDQLLEIQPPKDWSTSRDGGPRKIVREDLLLTRNEQKSRTVEGISACGHGLLRLIGAGRYGLLVLIAGVVVSGVTIVSEG